jgi:hypothetical protein
MYILVTFCTFGFGNGIDLASAAGGERELRFEHCQCA